MVRQSSTIVTSSRCLPISQHPGSLDGIQRESVTSGGCMVKVSGCNSKLAVFAHFTEGLKNVMDRSPAQAAAAFRELANGLRTSQALYVAAHLRVADHLAKRPLEKSELARLTAADPMALGRIMRALCALGIFSELRPELFSLNSLGHFLRSDVPGSFRAGVLLLAGPVRWQLWSGLLETVMTGHNACERLLGMQIFEFYASDKEQSKIHDEAMRSFSAAHAAILLDAIDFQRGGVVVDVGGGTGEFLAAILGGDSNLRGILFDLPNVIADAARVLSGVADRYTVEAGSFFDDVPKSGDVYLLKQVIHDWDDEHVTAILGCCRRCMPTNSRLLIIERILPELAEPRAGSETLLTDLEMLVTTSGGRERTETEFRHLLAKAGFEHRRTVATPSPLSIFEARPA